MRTLIAIPCLKQVDTQFFTDILGLEKKDYTQTVVTYSTMSYDARNDIAARAIEDGFDRVMWFDSDMTFSPNIFKTLANDMDEHDLDYVSGLYFMRTYPITKPVIFKNLIYDIQPEQVRIKAENFFDYPKDQLFEIAGSGFGGVLLKTSMLKKVADAFGLPFSPMMGFGEDITFCWRAKQLGIKMWCDSRVKMGHLATIEISEAHYLAQDAIRQCLDRGAAEE